MDISLDLSDCIMIFAVLIGPVLGVAVAIYLEKRREKSWRKLDVFRTLLRTRRARLWLDHVNALNLVEIEFYDDKQVIASFRKYIEHLSAPLLRLREEEPSPQDTESIRQFKEDRYWQRVSKERDTLFTSMLHSIATSLGFKKMQQLELMSGGYVPVGWNDREEKDNSVRDLFSDIATGKKLFPIAVVDFSSYSSINQDMDRPKEIA